MAGQPLERELDPTPLVAALADKTKAGKLSWQPTADDNTFIVSVGGETTFKLALEGVEGEDRWGQPEYTNAPVLHLLDSKGRKIWEISSSEVKGGLWPLYKLARRIGNKMDDKMAALMEVVEKL